jgi:glycerol-3-phosphate acyltransferase PlsX
MGAPVTIALDAMGGDHGPSVVVPAAAIALIRHPDLRFLLVGDSARIEPELAAHEALAKKATVIHTDVAVAMDAKPSQALRKGRWKSSMWLALEAVRDGRAAAAVSAGNTGALMAMAKFCLKTMEGVDRPAIAAIWPTVDAECIVLDVGRQCRRRLPPARRVRSYGSGHGSRSVRHGEAVGRAPQYRRRGDQRTRPDQRSRSRSQRAPLPIRYHGFVEGDDVGQGVVDVVVTDGYTGNIALKTAEGTAKQIGEYLRAAMGRSLLARLGAVLAQGAFRALKEKLDPRQLNGGIFLGLNGIVVKSHGGTDATGFASAIDLAYDMASNGVGEAPRQRCGGLPTRNSSLREPRKSGRARKFGE